MGHLFSENPLEPLLISCEKGPRILLEEMQTVIKTMKDSKALASDNVNTKFSMLTMGP